MSSKIRKQHKLKKKGVVFHGSNSAGRRKYRRLMERQKAAGKSAS